MKKVNSDNVISFPKNQFGKMTELHGRQSLPAYSYLMECKEILEEDEYVDVLCAIMDREYYDVLDPDLQDIVDTYYDYMI